MYFSITPAELQVALSEQLRPFTLIEEKEKKRKLLKKYLYKKVNGISKL